MMSVIACAQCPSILILSLISAVTVGSLLMICSMVSIVGFLQLDQFFVIFICMVHILSLINDVILTQFMN